MSELKRRRQRRKTLTDKMIAELPRRAGKTYFHPDPEMPKHGVRVRPVGPGTYTVITRESLRPAEMDSDRIDRRDADR